MTETSLEVVLVVLGALFSPVYTLLFWLLRVVGCHGQNIAVLENENQHHNHNNNNKNRKTHTSE